MLSANPEPYADVFDVVLLGDGEDMLAAFTQRMVEMQQQLGPPPSSNATGSTARREELLAAVASVPGMSNSQGVQWAWETLPCIDTRNSQCGAA